MAQIHGVYDAYTNAYTHSWHHHTIKGYLPTALSDYTKTL